jgi:oligogalacturonide transport system ATP-binding protein
VVNDLPPKQRGIAMVFQNYALYPHMKVYENLAFGLKLAGTSKAEVDQRVRQAAELLEMEHLLDRYPKQLSGGQAQRVAVGRAIVKKPEVFLFDEPLSNLDAKLRASMRVRLTELHRTLREQGQPATVVYVTHDQVEAMTMGERICVLKEGVIQQVDTPTALYNRPANAFVASFIGSPEMNIQPATLQSQCGVAGLVLGGSGCRCRRRWLRRCRPACRPCSWACGPNTSRAATRGRRWHARQRHAALAGAHGQRSLRALRHRRVPLTARVPADQQQALPGAARGSHAHLPPADGGLPPVPRRDRAHACAEAPPGPGGRRGCAGHAVGAGPDAEGAALRLVGRRRAPCGHAEGARAVRAAPPGLKIKAEYMGFNGYLERLTTQVAGGSEPDVMQINWAWLAMFSKRGTGVCRPGCLQRTLLSLDQFSAGDLAMGRVAGKLNALPVSYTARVLLWNQTSFGAPAWRCPTAGTSSSPPAGVPPPLGEHHYPLDGELYDMMLLAQAYVHQKHGTPYVDPLRAARARGDERRRRALTGCDLPAPGGQPHRHLAAAARQPGRRREAHRAAAGLGHRPVGRQLHLGQRDRPAQQHAAARPAAGAGRFPTLPGARNSGMFGRPTLMYAVGRNCRQPETRRASSTSCSPMCEPRRLLGRTRGAPARDPLAAAACETSLPPLELQAHEQLQKLKPKVASTCPAPLFEHARLHKFMREVFETVAYGKADATEAAARLVKEGNALLNASSESPCPSTPSASSSSPTGQDPDTGARVTRLTPPTSPATATTSTRSASPTTAAGCSSPVSSAPPPARTGTTTCSTCSQTALQLTEGEGENTFGGFLSPDDRFLYFVRADAS